MEHFTSQAAAVAERKKAEDMLATTRAKVHADNVAAQKRADDIIQKAAQTYGIDKAQLPASSDATEQQPGLELQKKGPAHDHKQEATAEDAIETDEPGQSEASAADADESEDVEETPDVDKAYQPDKVSTRIPVVDNVLG